MPRPRRAIYRKRGPNRHQLRFPFGGRALHYWRGLGPGLVTRASDNDPSGIGTYSARVVVHGDHYAATWDGGDHGGYMWGKVVKGTKEEPKERDKSKDKAKP